MSFAVTESEIVRQRRISVDETRYFTRGSDEDSELRLLSLSQSTMRAIDHRHAIDDPPDLWHTAFSFGDAY
jgi:hypothetical protein